MGAAKPKKARKHPAGGITGAAGDRLAENYAKMTKKQKAKVAPRTKQLAEEAIAIRKKRADGRY